MKRTIRWTATNALFLVFGYLALVQDINGAKNVLQFYIWFAFATSILVLTPPGIKQMSEHPEKMPSRTWQVIDVIFDTACIIVLVWYGWVWASIAYLLHMLFMQAAISNAKDHIFRLLGNKGDSK